MKLHVTARRTLTPEIEEFTLTPVDGQQCHQQSLAHTSLSPLPLGLIVIIRWFTLVTT